MSPTANGPTPNWPGLNWKEIEILGTRIAPELEGLFLDRLVVPARPHHPEGYIKGEWALRFTGRKVERTLIFSVRPRHPYFALYSEKGPVAAARATHSPFDLALSKHVKELKLLKIWVPTRERILVLDFERKMRLAFLLIPSTPEALLVEAPDSYEKKTWPVIARSRTIRENPEAARTFQVPDGARAPLNLEVRSELMDPESFHEALEGWIERDAFALRLQSLEKAIREKLKTAQDRFRQSEVARNEGRQEPDWQRYADLLKNSIGTIPEGLPDKKHPVRNVTDYETGEKISVPCDPKLGLRAQIEKFYLHSRRKQKRMSEASNRIEAISGTLQRLEMVSIGLKSLEPSKPDWAPLERIEREVLQSAGAGRSSGRLSGSSKRSGWLGRSALSRDGWAIWIGKSRDENLELTFKHARGNDLWMHVRGRPGAHVVIPVQPGKSVPLETLLDAANLVVYYSGGENWGKTEVDYTFKKHVKRIKDSTEASYVHNKTLIVEPDRIRLKRLLGEKN